MADQNKMMITSTVPTTAVRGSLVSGAGTFSATLRAVGVCTDDADGASKGPLQIGGTAFVKLGATLTAGTLIVSDASGNAIANTEDTDVVNGTNHLICGVLLEGGNSGELCRAKIL
jgi:hypothetical protein